MAFLFVTACKRSPGPAAVPAPPVVVAEVVATNVTLHTEFIGQLDSPQNVEVRARVEAFVDQVLFQEGTEVKAGDPLFKLDARPYQERLAAAMAALAEAEAALKKYEKDVARLQPLAEKRAIPQQDLDNALASVDVGKAGVLSAQARVESAKLDLSYCDVRAPISGLIGAKEVSVGSLVGKGQPTLLATISQMNPIWFYCNIGEVDFLRAEEKARESQRRLGELPVSLILADGKVLPDSGKWVFIDRAIDVTTGTIRARAEFANANYQVREGLTNWVLRPGMFARARIPLKTEGAVLLAPLRAVQELQGKNFVWVVGADKIAKQRMVKVGQEVGSDVIILENLKAGERIIVDGVQKAKDGEPVEPRTAAEMAKAATAQPKSPEGTSAKE